MANLALKAIKNITADKFIAIYQAVHKVPYEEAKNFFEVEVFSFKRILEETPTLQDCSELSVQGVFLEVISNGLSFEKTSNHIYLMPRSVKIGPNQYEKRLTYTEQAAGLIYLCKAAGSITHCTEATIVYEGDVISVKTIHGVTDIKHEKAIPRKSNKILGGYCVVTTSTGQNIQHWVDIEEVARLKEYSNKNNRGNQMNDKSNSLYTSGDDGQIDAGFFRTKIVKSALKRFSKKKTLTDFHEENSVFKTDYVSTHAIEEEQMAIEQSKNEEIPERKEKEKIPVVEHNNIPNEEENLAF